MCLVRAGACSRGMRHVMARAHALQRGDHHDAGIARLTVHPSLAPTPSHSLVYMHYCCLLTAEPCSLCQQSVSPAHTLPDHTSTCSAHAVSEVVPVDIVETVIKVYSDN